MCNLRAWGSILVINWSIADSHEAATKLKATAKTLLDQIIQSDQEDRSSSEISFRIEDSEPQLWARSLCRLYGDPRRVYTLIESEPQTAHYCSNCWELDLFSPENQHIAHATRALSKTLRGLPPGAKLTAIIIGGKEIPIKPPVEVGEDGEG